MIEISTNLQPGLTLQMLTASRKNGPKQAAAIVHPNSENSFENKQIYGVAARTVDLNPVLCGLAISHNKPCGIPPPIEHQPVGAIPMNPSWGNIKRILLNV
ncbi:MAG: hypothetical protein AB2767_07290 [Candidatus Thiodiazotropha taylori]